jgi:hypothetical protein
MASEEMRKRVFELGQNPIVSTSAEFSDVIRSDFPYWVRVIKSRTLSPWTEPAHPKAPRAWREATDRDNAIPSALPASEA